ncbi:MAG: helix-turn-helix domain-containing protein [Candidatus Thorarchaeota archaeon]|jgi:putative transcriptional regulator
MMISTAPMTLQSPIRERLARRIAGEIALSDIPGQAMRTWRERFRLQQVDLAKHIGISPSVISDYESGRRKSPGTSTIRRFVLALLELDEQSGGQVRAGFERLMAVSPVDLNIVLAMSEISPISAKDFCKSMKFKVLTGHDYLEKEIYGYSLIDAEAAVKELTNEQFIKLFGATIERCLIFTKVSTGRAALVALKSQEFKPTVVVLHTSSKIDHLAAELAEQMKIPLAVSQAKSIDRLIKSLRRLNPEVT